MMSLLPGVHGSGISEGSGSGAMGAVVAVVDPARAEVGLVLTDGQKCVKIYGYFGGNIYGCFGGNI